MYPALAASSSQLSAPSAHSPTFTAPRTTPYSSIGDALGGPAVAPPHQPHSLQAQTNVSVGAGFPHISGEGKTYYPGVSTATEHTSFDYSYQQQQHQHGPGAVSSSAAYEPNQQPQFTVQQASSSSLPPMRSMSPAAHVASAGVASQFAPVMPSAYTPGQAGGSHQQAQQHGLHQQQPPSSYGWPEENWGQASHFTSDEVQQHMIAARSDVAGSPAADSRANAFNPPIQYPPSSTTSINIRPDSRPGPGQPSNVSPGGEKGKAREHEANYRSPSTPFSSGHTDYGKVIIRIE